MVNPGCDLPTSRTAVALAGKFPHVYAAVGFHPSDCAGCEGDWLEEIRALAQSSPKVVAIGEIGLDYYWKDNPPRDRIAQLRGVSPEELEEQTTQNALQFFGIRA